MKKQKFLKPCFVFLALLAFSMLSFGGVDSWDSKIQTEKVGGKQIMEENSVHANEVDTVAGLREAYRHEVNTSDSDVVQFVSPVWHEELARVFYLVFK